MERLEQQVQKVKSLQEMTKRKYDWGKTINVDTESGYFGKLKKWYSPA